MRHNTQRLFSSFFATLVIIIGLSSCGTTKQLTYFQDVVDSGRIVKQLADTSFYAKIQPGDVLGIDVLNINPAAAAPYNLGNSTSAMQPTQYLSTSVSGSPMLTSQIDSRDPGGKGYLVSKEGTINFVGIGTLNVAGLTTSEVSQLVRRPLVEKYLKDETTIVNVRILNYKINILGEVSRPATYSIPTSRVSIIDAISMANDLTPYGDREKITVIREENGQRTSAILNLKSSKIFESPYFYLKQNDVVYVAPLKNKEISVDAKTNRLISLGSLLLGITSVIISAITLSKQ